MLTWMGWIDVLVLDLCTLVPLLLIPRLTSNYFLLGVYVPEEDRSLPAVLEIRRKYTMMFMAMSIVGLGIGLAMYVTSDIIPEAIFIMTLCIQLIGVGISMVVCRRYALQLKIAQQWAIPAEATRKLADLKFRERPSVLHNGWFLIHLLIVVLCVGVVIVRWDSIPDTYVSHYTFEGKPDRYFAKSFATIFMINFIQLGQIALFIFINTVFKISKQHLDPNNPVISRNNQLQFRRANSIFLYVLSLFIIALQGFNQAEMLFNLRINGLDILSIFIPLFLIGGFLTFLIYLDKRGLNSHKDLKIMDDRQWRSGVFYYNVTDPSLFVAKRYGIGWTLNFARPLSWVLIGVILLLGVSSIVITAS